MGRTHCRRSVIQAAFDRSPYHRSDNMASQSELTVAPGAPLPLRSTPARVLIVDDEPSVRLVLRRALSSGPYEIEEAEDGVEAYAILQERGADLVLSDFLMPRMNGLELLDRAKSLDDTIGFIILTGAGTLEGAVQALRQNASDYLLKPFNIDEIRIAAQRALQHRRLLRENRTYQRLLEQRVAEQAQEIERMFVDALLTIANAVEARDGYTGEHVERVTCYTVAIGRKLGLSLENLRHLWVGGLLHDVGKIGIPDEVLKKPGKLTVSEYEIMKRHPLISAAIVERSAFLRPALPGILHHHERWDGGGYPYGLAGTDIPLQGRILSVADTYDAIITTRPYREKRSPSEAIAELRRCSGSQFDAEVVDAFVEAMQEGLDGDMPLWTSSALAGVPLSGTGTE